MNKLVIKRESLICFLILLPFFKPPIVDTIPGSYRMYQLFYLAVLFWTMSYFIKTKKKLDSIVLLFIAFEGTIALSSVLGGADINLALMYMERIVLISAVFCMYKRRLIVVLKALMFHLEICVYSNFITLIIEPDGFFSRTIAAYGATQEWFLGADNQFVIWLFPAVFVALLYSQMNGEKRRAGLLIFTALATELIQGSGTGIIGIVVLLICSFAPFIKKVITPYRSIFIGIVIFLSFVIYRNYDIFEPIIVGLLGKDLTMTNRIFIWDNVLACIKNRPILGYGYVPTGEMPSYIGNVNGILWLGATHCHNHFLQVLFQGGIVGMILLLCIYFSSCKACYRSWNSRISQVSVYAIFAFSVMGITEVFNYPLIYMIFSIAYYSREISEQIDISNSK